MSEYFFDERVIDKETERQSSEQALNIQPMADVKLTDKEKDEKMPPDVLYLLAIKSVGGTIGVSLYNEILEKHPEWFPEETEFRRKWGAIPQQIKDAYFKEVSEINHYGGHEYSGRGLTWYMEHPQEYAEYDKWLSLKIEESVKKEKKLHDKYFKEYGL